MEQTWWTNRAGHSIRVMCSLHFNQTHTITVKILEFANPGQALISTAIICVLSFQMADYPVCG